VLYHPNFERRIILQGLKLNRFNPAPSTFFARLNRSMAEPDQACSVAQIIGSDEIG
jgi:hypothetical protein